MTKQNLTYPEGHESVSRLIFMPIGSKLWTTEGYRETNIHTELFLLYRLALHASLRRYRKALQGYRYWVALLPKILRLHSSLLCFFCFALCPHILGRYALSGLLRFTLTFHSLCYLGVQKHLARQGYKQTNKQTSV